MYEGVLDLFVNILSIKVCNNLDGCVGLVIFEKSHNAIAPLCNKL